MVQTWTVLVYGYTEVHTYTYIHIHVHICVCMTMSVLLALALSRGPLRDSLPSFRGTLRASTSLGLDDVGFASKLAWDLVGYPLYVFFYVGLLMRVFAR